MSPPTLLIHLVRHVSLMTSVCMELEQRELRKFLKATLYKTPIIRVDHDSTKKVGAMEAIVKQIHSSDAAILVGTQMLAKGHDFPKGHLKRYFKC